MTSAGGNGTSRPLWERGWVLWVSSGVLVAVIVAMVLLVVGGNGAQATHPTSADAAANATDGIPAGLNQATADLLSVSPVPTDMPAAPAFRLTDQHGRAVNSGQFRGKAVVLIFNDDRCTDLCVMLSNDIIAADHDMPAFVRSHVQFVAINANPYYPTPADANAWSVQHGLDTLPNWTFVTGTPKQLAATARAFSVPVRLDPATRTIQHGSQILILNPQGREVLQASFGPQSADTAPFGHGLAVLANDALPQAQQGLIAGANLARAIPGGTGLGDRPVPIAGPSLAGGTPLTTATDRGRYTVVDFWSSTCTVCRVQLPQDQVEADSLSGAVAFVGVDVSDNAGAARALLTREHIRFPTLADSSGEQAARFRVSELPYTVILSPSGSVVVRHPGLFTGDELDFELRSLNPGLGAPKH